MADSTQKPASREDPRWLRTRQALIDAVLELAAEQPIRLLSVNAITKHAGVDRTTFYNHAESPEALLHSVLREELDAVFDDFHARLKDGNRSLARLQDRGIRALMRHVFERQHIYRSSLENDDSNLLYSVLVEFIDEKATLLVEENQYHFAGAGASSDFLRSYAARVVATGMVGGVTTWLTKSENLDIEQFMDAYYRTMPSWFTMVDRAMA